MQKLVFATHNPHKIEEIRKIKGLPVEIIGLSDIGCNDDIAEPFDTLEENALAKALYILKQYNLPCFADDTGLEVFALHMEPGVLSARYAGDEKDSNMNMAKLLLNLIGKTNRSARFRTVIAYASNREQKQFEGIVQGTILEQKMGSSGFGYDPIFMPNGFNTSFAQMSMDQKNTISHRALAMKAFVDWITSDITLI